MNKQRVLLRNFARWQSELGVFISALWIAVDRRSSEIPKFNSLEAEEALPGWARTAATAAASTAIATAVAATTEI